MKKIRWGILSTAKIAKEHLIPAMQASEFGEVVAVASRSMESAQAFATASNIPTAYGSYEDLINDPNIDAIYNPLPNHLHVPWSIKAIEAGKHVLVEKPISLDIADLAPLFACVKAHPQIKVMEAFMYRFHPQRAKIQAICNSPEFGPLHSIQSAFNYNNREADNIRHDASMGGGALMDIGCYNISFARMMFKEEPIRVVAKMQKMPGFEVDCITSAILDFPNGTSIFSCSTKSEHGQWAQIQGESGSLRISPPYNPTKDDESEIRFQHNDKVEVISIPPVDQYQLMVNAFARAILDDTPVPTPLSDAEANMKVIDAIVKSAKDRAWVEIN